MSNVRDPAFWRRFSLAVHLDDEEKQQHQTAETSTSTPQFSQRPTLKHSPSWLERQQAKKRRRTCICWIFWLCFFALVAGVVIVVLWLKANGLLGGQKSSSGPFVSADGNAATTSIGP